MQKNRSLRRSSRTAKHSKRAALHEIREAVTQHHDGQRHARQHRTTPRHTVAA